ncbi:hypothetical protein LY10_04333 [Planktotalea frisia]|uniref:Helix-turn-helix domain protein n=1 Tax=Planktotalea frisia TaxID=696762 RepID=A0A1L9NV72_9RHOB|nr:hypothetical protein [Planktotalea frisia]OJI93083.1 hypothetical protein PFRI_26980 [Planktotalea frisia]PZX16784.1 hypothetical protein LY10_04333 [Planktotalea frisia]
MSRRFRTRAIKANKSYTVDELADAACVSIPTVRNWIKDGMPLIDGNRPMIILGFHALEYLNARKAKSKQPMALGEFYCLRCKAPRTPFGAMADYVPSSDTGGRLKAICGVCECACNRNVSARDLPDIRKVLDVEIRGSW